MSGLFITLEGTEGAGKSSLVKVVKDYLEGLNRRVICVREPGGTPIAEDMRAILKTVRSDDELCPKAELILMYAARAQLVETLIKPRLAEGYDVVCDRHDLSTVAYQGGGRGIPFSTLDMMRQVALGDFRPDLTLLLDVDPVVGMQRARSRGSLDRFEQSEMDFFVRVRNTYLKCAEKHPDKIKVIDASVDQQSVTREALKILESLVC